MSKTEKLLIGGIGAVALILIIAIVAVYASHRTITTVHGEKVVYNSGFYKICMDQYFRSRKACECLAEHVSINFPEFEKSITIDDVNSDRDMRGEVFLKARLPCEPIAKKERCRAEAKEIGNKEKRQKFEWDCACEVSEMSNNRIDMYHDLKNMDIFNEYGTAFSREASSVLSRYSSDVYDKCSN